MLIESAHLTAKQLAVIQLLMRGYSIQDIADVSGKSKQSISNMFSRALDALVAENERKWKSVIVER